MSRVMRAYESLSRFFTGAGFPVFALGVIALYELALVALTLVPPSDEGLGAFAEEFRIWCMGGQAGTGSVNWAYALGMLTPPLVVAATVAWLWSAPLRALRVRPLAAIRPFTASLVIAVAGAALVLLYGPRPARGELPFPAEALRTGLPPPPIRLRDQVGRTVDLASLKGRVVLLTGVYASCSRTCPSILAEAKRVVGGLEPREREDLQVIAVTLDPEHDTPDVLARLAEAQGIAPPVWHLLTGDVAEVERTLDRMGIARTRDPATGFIDHANLFLLVDRRGRLAYRFTLGPRQERWLSSAVRLLLREPPDAG